MIEFLTSATFDFGVASTLSEDEHKNAFIKIFSEIFYLFIKLIGNITEIKIISKYELQFASVQFLKTKKSFEYSLSIKDFVDNIGSIASVLYLSQNYEVQIIFKGKQEFTVLVAMDPVYISIRK